MAQARVAIPVLSPTPTQRRATDAAQPARRVAAPRCLRKAVLRGMRG